jgi:hypothetical protein
VETNKIDYNHIRQYLEGRLDEKSMHELEKRALDDPFLAEAIEGYAGFELPSGPPLSILQRQLEERVARNEQDKQIFHFNWQRVSVAAAAGLMFITAGILFWFKGNQADKQLASQPKQVEVALTYPDSSQTNADPARNKTLEPRTQPESRNAAPASVTLTDPPASPEAARRPARYSRIAAAGAKTADLVVDTTAVADVPGAPAGEVATVSLSAAADAENRQKAVARTLTDAARRKEAIPITVSGKVTDRRGQALPGVIITARDGALKTNTDAAGNYSISVNEGDTLRLDYIGFESKELLAGTKRVDVSLAEASNALSEVAVTVGAGTGKEAMPVSGWKKFNEYLKQATAGVNGTGKVKLRFTLDTNGTPVGIVVEKGVDSVIDRKAIEILEAGPKWHPGTKSEITTTIKF